MKSLQAILLIILLSFIVCDWKSKAKTAGKWAGSIATHVVKAALVKAIIGYELDESDFEGLNINETELEEIADKALEETHERILLFKKKPEHKEESISDFRNRKRGIFPKQDE